MKLILSNNYRDLAGDPVAEKRYKIISEWMRLHPTGNFRDFWNECGDGDKSFFNLAREQFVGMKNPGGNAKRLDQLV